MEDAHHANENAGVAGMLLQFHSVVYSVNSLYYPQKTSCVHYVTVVDLMKNVFNI